MNEKMPLLSVIVPIYNVENYLSDCLNSILTQTFTDFELILIDDGSKDNSSSLCDQFSEKDSRVIVIHKDNTGLSDCRNLGIKTAKAEYITFVDSDDVVDSNMFTILMKPLLKNQNILVSCCSSFMFYDSFHFNAVSDVDYRNINLQEYDQIYERWVTPWGKIYKKTLFENIQYPLNRLHEDVATTYKILYPAGIFSTTNLQLYGYRQRKGSIMARLSEKAYLDKADAYLEKGQYFLNHDEIYFIKSNVDDLIYTYKILATYIYTTENKKIIKEKLKTIKQTIYRKYFKYLKFTKRIKTIIRLSLPLFCYKNKNFE